MSFAQSGLNLSVQDENKFANTINESSMTRKVSGLDIRVYSLDGGGGGTPPGGGIGGGNIFDPNPDPDPDPFNPFNPGGGNSGGTEVDISSVSFSVEDLDSSSGTTFRIEQSIGVLGRSVDLVAIRALDFEQKSEYRLKITASTSFPRRTGNLNITVDVTDNLFETITIVDIDDGINTINENASSGTKVANIEWEVRDEVDNLVTERILWEIDPPSNLFVINSSSGSILLAQNAILDYEASNSYTLTVSTNVLGGLNGSGSSQSTIEINVVNLLEDITIQDTDNSDNTINENTSPGTTVENLMLEVRDEGDRIIPDFAVTWSLLDSADSGTFIISSMGGVISLSSTATLDYESTPSYNLLIQAEALVEGVIARTTLLITIDVANVLESITVQDVNDSANTIFDDASLGTIVLDIELQARDENLQVRTNQEHNLMWVFAPDGNPNDLFSIDIATGSLRWNSSESPANSLPPSERSFRVSVIATALNEANVMIQSEPLEVLIEVRIDVRLRTRLYLEGPLQ